MSCQQYRYRRRGANCLPRPLQPGRSACFPGRSARRGRRRIDPALQRQLPAGGARRSAPARRGDALARQGDGHRRTHRACSSPTCRSSREYWATDYDWRKIEATLNALPQFVTEIDGLDIHFIHVRSKHENALPIIVTHGWPGSIIEQLKIIGPLTDPTAHGGSAADAFHVVIPSLPGYGFSGKPTAPGWTPVTHRQSLGDADAAPRLHEIRRAGRRLGQCRLRADGAAAAAGTARHPHQHGGHRSAEIAKALACTRPPPADLTADERNAWEQLDVFYKKGLGYAIEMTNRPQTLYGIADSPVGLAAWMLDHDIRSYELIARVFDGKAEGLTRDDILDNVTLYWLTNTAISSARLYWDTAQFSTAPASSTPGASQIPVAVSAFPDEIYAAPKSWAEQAYPKLIYYNKLAKGGHFAAWEQPALFPPSCGPRSSRCAKASDTSGRFAARAPPRSAAGFSPARPRTFSPHVVSRRATRLAANGRSRRRAPVANRSGLLPPARRSALSCI